MRVRDRHFVRILAVMLALNFVTAAASVAGVVVYRRRFHDLAEKTSAMCESSERSSVQAAAATLALADRLRDLDGSVAGEDAGVVLEPVVVGYGQTKTKAARYVYRDLRDPDGSMRREFILRIPF